MELKTTEEFIRQVHGAACSTLKTKFEKEFPELFKKELVVGKWYVYGRSLLNYQGLNHKDLIQACGFLGDKSWMETSNCGNDFKAWREATHEEVESALVAEAKKRGYKIGVNTEFGVINDVWDKWRWDGIRLYHHDISVFKKDQWTKILPEEKTIITKEKALKIIAKKLKVSPESIEIK